jgi:hypothetical protein
MRIIRTRDRRQFLPVGRQFLPAIFAALFWCIRGINGSQVVRVGTVSAYSIVPAGAFLS